MAEVLKQQSDSQFGLCGWFVERFVWTNLGERKIDLKWLIFLKNWND